MGPDDLNNTNPERAALDSACDMFRGVLRPGPPGAREIAPLTEDRITQLMAFGDAVRDAAIGAGQRDVEALEAAFAQTREIGSQRDMGTVMDSLHVPEEAGEHEDALRRLLLRIPDGWGRWISGSSGRFALARSRRARARDRVPDLR